MVKSLKKFEFVTQKNVVSTVTLAALTGILFAALLVIKSSLDFSHSGPEIRKEVMDFYKGYSVYAMARLGFWAAVLTSLMASVGMLVYHAFRALFGWRYHWYWAVIAGGVSFGVLTVLQLSRHLLYIPGRIIASSLYRTSRFYPLWDLLTPERLEVVQWVLLAVIAIPVCFALVRLARMGDRKGFYGIGGCCGMLAALVVWATWSPAPAPVRTVQQAHQKLPNIVMIGSDSLRADRVGGNGYERSLTPFIDSLASRGVRFSNCYVPLARTAPSLTSYLTSTWPHTHGIRDNYIADGQVKLDVPTLPLVLKAAGYRTAAIADWAGGDLKKIRFGFDSVNAPDDQWNIKYLIRQGPKDIRLFLSLFTYNRFGRTFLPEIYYVAGTPMNQELGRVTRATINELAGQNNPFFLMVFTSATHGPFGSEYPYYTMYADKKYRGESKFCMGGVSTPEEVIKMQALGKKHFDVQQIIDLYDGAVRSFDDEVARVVRHLEACGLDRNTIIVVFSDHGFELFERHTWGQGNDLLGDDYSARVPLVIADPRNTKGRVVSRTTRSIDFAPTLLDLIGLGPVKGFEGVSLAGDFLGGNGGNPLVAFHETGIWLNKVPGAHKNHLSYPTVLELMEVADKQTGTISIKPELERLVIRAKDRMVRDDRWKLARVPTVNGAEFSLYDMNNDPLCTTDVSRQHPEAFNRLKTSLEDLMAHDATLRQER